MRWVKKYSKKHKSSFYFALLKVSSNNLGLVDSKRKFSTASEASEYAEEFDKRYEQLKIAKDLVEAKPKKKRGRPKKKKDDDADTPESNTETE
jgi:hypothetical protein